MLQGLPLGTFGLIALPVEPEHVLVRLLNSRDSLFFLGNSSTAEDVSLDCFEHLKRSEAALGDAQEAFQDFVF